MSTAAILDRAADHIARYGLNKGSAFADPVNCYTSPACVMGAIGLTDSSSAEFDRAMDALAEHLNCEPMHVHQWSDTSTQTHVIETLRACAVIEAARETTSSHVVTTSPHHVRIVAARHNLELVEVDGYLLATLFVPALGEALVYQARVTAGVA